METWAEQIARFRALIGVSNVVSVPAWPQSARRLVDILIPVRARSSRSDLLTALAVTMRENATESL
jgi:hypothetical protein